MRKRPLALGLVISALVHAILGVLVQLAATDSRPAPEDEPLWFVDVDIHQPPEAPEAHTPRDEPDQPDEPAEPAGSDDSSQDEAPSEERDEILHTPPPAEPEPPEDDAIAEITDAGIPDAALAHITRDAGPSDAALAHNIHDANTSDAALARNIHDAGSSDAAALAGAPTPGTGTAGAGDAGSGQGATAAAAPHPGADADLLAYLPEGDVLAVMIRFDRLRDTPWAQAAEAVLAPMPDYRTLIGRRVVSIADLFETLVISTPRPRDVTATTLIGHTLMPGSQIRTFLDHPDAPVAWSTARGGALGRRRRSPHVHPGDRRVFLQPFPEWIALSQPQHFGPLIEPATGDVGQAKATDLPPWLARIPTIEAEAGIDTGPALVITIAGLLPPAYRAPYIGTIVTPQRLSLALEVAPQGFSIRGTMDFAGAARARRFVAEAERARRDFVGSRIGQALLSRMHIYNALRGLSLKQNQARVGFATSISIADAQAMMAYAAEWTKSFYLPAPSRAAPPPEH